MKPKNEKKDKPAKITEPDKSEEKTEQGPQKDNKEPEAVKGKKKNIIVFKTLHAGDYKRSFYTQNEKGDTVKVFATFKNHECRLDAGNTKEKFLIKELEAVMEAEADKDTKQKSVLTELEYLSITSPESLYINYGDKRIHIEEVRKGLEIAEKHGWKPIEDTKVQIGVSKSKIVRGGASAGAVSIGT